jgi:hypothetical protein
LWGTDIGRHSGEEYEEEMNGEGEVEYEEE